MSDLAAAVQAAFRQTSPPAPYDPRRPDWQAHGACQGADPNVFFPNNGAAHAAKAVCAVCPVRAECLDYALDNNEQFGVWGGATVEERRRLRRRRPAATP